MYVCSYLQRLENYRRKWKSFSFALLSIPPFHNTIIGNSTEMNRTERNIVLLAAEECTALRQVFVLLSMEQHFCLAKLLLSLLEIGLKASGHVATLKQLI